MSRQQILQLYRQLLKSSRLYASYNYREYVYRRTRDAFHANASISDPRRIDQLYAKGLESLKISQRQGWINSQFALNRLIVE